MYDLGRQAFLEGTIAWLTDDIKVAFVDAGVYTPNTVTDQFYSSIASVIALSGNLAGKTSTLGVADADDLVVSSVTGAEFEYVVLFKDSGLAATSPLIALFDTAVGLPFTPSGANITVTWDNGANRIFKL